MKTRKACYRDPKIEHPQWVRRAERDMETIGIRLLGALLLGCTVTFVVACWPFPSALVIGITTACFCARTKKTRQDQQKQPNQRK